MYRTLISLLSRARNSEVIHSGIYYPIGSLKSELCVRGRQLLYERCDKLGIGYRKTEKLIVATSNSQVPYLDSLQTHSLHPSLLTSQEPTSPYETNSVIPTYFLSGHEARDLEPDLGGDVRAALLVTETGIVDSQGLVDSLEREIEEADFAVSIRRGDANDIEEERGEGVVVMGTRVVRVDRAEDGKGWIVQIETGWEGKRDGEKGDVESVHAAVLVDAAGIGAATLLEDVVPAGERTNMWLAKGNYMSYKGPGVGSISRLIYPCPSDDLDTLGTHLTLDLEGNIKFGPDVEYIGNPTLYSEDPDYWQSHLAPSSSRLASIAQAVQSYLPRIDPAQLTPDYSGFRPNISPPQSGFSDFVIRHHQDRRGLVELLGFNSPGLTSSLAVGEYVAHFQTGTSRIPGGPMSGPISASLGWSSGGGTLRLEDAVVETVVTHTTRTTTSFAPINLPRIPQPDTITLPHHLPSDVYPLAHEPSPEDMRFFAINLGGRRVVIQEDGTATPEAAEMAESRGAGWTRSMVGVNQLHNTDRIDLAEAIGRPKGKEVRKRPHDFSRPASKRQDGAEVISLPITAECLARQRSPPRKKTRGLEDMTILHDGSSALLSPLPSPEHEMAPSSSTHQNPDAAPSVGSGLEVAALFSLPAIVAQFDTLPDKLQQHVLMHLFRRSRMPTIQRLSAFTSSALKRDFISHLPHEIAVQILRKVDVKSLAAAARVSQKWKKMVDSERAVWRQRLIDDGMWYGLGVEEEEENTVKRRFETLDWNAQRVPKAGTPSEDDEMLATTAHTPEVDRPTPLKHVYRRRYTSDRNWLHSVPEHTTFAGHGTNVVTCLQFDADKIVSASDDHSINIYDTVGGRLRKRLDGHEGGVWALEYKGDTLVSGSTDRTVRVWDLDTLQEVHVFHGHTSTVRCLQIVEPVFDPATGEYQPPCPMIVTGSRDASLRVWKLPKKGEPAYRRAHSGFENIISPEENPFHVHHLEGHTQAVRALAAYGRICVSGSYDCAVRVWDIVKGTCLHVLTGHESKVYSIVYDRYRNRCASGSMDNSVKVWDVSSGECLYTLTGHTSLVGLLGTSPNHLVSAAADASLRIWDSNSQQLKHVLSSHTGAITCFQHDETKVVSGSDGTLKLWDIKTGAYVRDLVVGISSVWQVQFNGSLLVAASNRNGSTVFDVFNFGAICHQSGIDDEKLDTLRRPAYERGNPREPQTYQSDDVDYLASPDFDRLGDIESGAVSPDVSDIYRVGSESRRRSHRIASRSEAVAHRGAPATYGNDLPRSSRRGTARRLDFMAGSPSPAGPSSSTSYADHSFPPIFDEERIDEPMEEVE
ncbi:F-box and WD-40 domain protein CDC4, partial [Tremellales sp. Uapishka_1]